jgi:dTDP-4-amino-4,6-dideoxygalactose transaminase
MTTSRTISFVDLATKYAPYSLQFQEDLKRVLASGNYILGGEVARLEDSIKEYSGSPYAIAVANGTDALLLSLKAAGVKRGDEVITTPMSYLATTSSIVLSGATAVFVDVDASLNLDPQCIEEAISEKTKAISVVHLAGIPAQIERIADIADKYRLALIEDCAQSLGATLNGRFTGTFGRFGALSFHPLKNLGTPGDGGMVLMRDPGDSDWMLQARNHGHRGRDDCDFWSINSRLDELHAAFLSSQLKGYSAELNRRKRLAQIYLEQLGGIVEFPEVVPGSDPSYNWIMILVERREDLISYLEKSGVEVKVHYPKLIPEMRAAKENCRSQNDLPNAKRMVKRILSLPTSEHITEADAHYVCQRVSEFFRK